MPKSDPKAPLVEFAELWCSHQKVPVSADDIAKFENKFAVRLPDDYVRAICETGALWPNLPVAEGKPDIMEIFGPNQIVIELDELSERFLGEIDFLPIASNGFDLFAFEKSELRTSRPQTAPVYQVDLYVPAYEDPAQWPSTDDVEKVADSFDGWIAGLLPSRGDN